MPNSLTSQEVPKQIIEKLETFECKQLIHYGSVCGELAAYRVRYGKISETLCEAHAQKYLRGGVLLKFPKCQRCQQSCEDTFIRRRDIGAVFCSPQCQDIYEGNPND